MKRFFVLLFCLCLCLSACQSSKQTDEEAFAGEEEQVDVPQEDSVLPSESAESAAPGLSFSEEPITQADLSVYMAGFDFPIYDDAYLPLFDTGIRAGFASGKLPIYRDIPQAQETRKIKVDEQEAASLKAIAQRYFSCLSLAQETAVIEREDDYVPLSYQVGEAVVNVLRTDLRVLNLETYSGLCAMSEESLLRELRENPFLEAACEMLGIDKPRIFAQEIYHEGSLEHYQILISQTQEDFQKQVHADNFEYLRLSVTPDFSSMQIGIYRWNTETVEATVPILSYEDALSNLLSGNAFGNSRTVEFDEQNVLSCRIVYENHVFADGTDCFFVPCYEFVLRNTQSTEAIPATTTFYIPACNVSVAAQDA